MLPDKMQKAYNDFYQIVQGNEILDPKTTRLLQLAASMAVGCYP
ncbi:MAG: carboxymuconolactone decarboxylase family protein [Deltaproteobacteria bacterium]|nr:carboxymuconolactone decarboxylase family protein [Deltaproteobacteria bacterium]